MPIYAYKCSACQHEQDVLQKMSDPLLTVCPQCGQSTYVKQVTAAGFQLKGTGWYVTDFRDNGTKPGGEKKATGSAGDSVSPAPAAHNDAAPHSPPAASAATPASGPTSAPASAPPVSPGD